MTTILRLLCACLLIGVCYGINTYDLPSYGLLSMMSPSMDNDWMIFKKTYNKTYADADEEIRRRLYWEDTHRFFDEHNSKFFLGEVTYTVGENEFSDMAEDEFESIFMNGVILPEVPEEYPEALTEPDPEAEVSMDWRKHGLVSSVKNQGQCGSCWAFAALAALEGQHAKKTKRILDMSEQNLVDCANSRWGNWGCRGGWMNNAFNYIKSNNGIDGESCYPYRATDGYCRYRSSCKVSTDRGAKNVGKSEHSLQSELSTVGPISIAMDVNHRGFWSYRSGVFYEARCNKNRPTHAMTAVGYGKAYNRDVWLIKNSWGPSWGDKGYVYAARNAGDTCGISLYASYPIV